MCVVDIKIIEKEEPNILCPRIEDLEGDCKVDGPKGCINYMRKTYKANMIIAYMQPLHVT